MSMVKNGKTDGHKSLHMNGCSCHNTKRDRRAAMKGAKIKDNKTAIKREAKAY